MSSAGVRCPKCGAETDVVDTRSAPDNSTRRRRRCKKQKCRMLFTTYEVLSGSGISSELFQTLAEATTKLDSAKQMVLKLLRGQ